MNIRYINLQSGSGKLEKGLWETYMPPSESQNISDAITPQNIPNQPQPNSDNLNTEDNSDS